MSLVECNFENTVETLQKFIRYFYYFLSICSTVLCSQGLCLLYPCEVGTCNCFYFRAGLFPFGHIL